MRLLVLGSGLQGSACAYDLLQASDVSHVTLADIRIAEPAPFLKEHVGSRLGYLQLDVGNRDATLVAMSKVQGAMSAAPYYFNADLAALAVEAGVHFCDLGGNTEIVQKQKELHNAAIAKRVSVIPDCGLAPGMVNILAQYGIDQLDSVEEVRIYVGGLPQDPRPPLNYQVVYSLEGMLDYYTTPSWVLRNAKRATVAALSDIEPVLFPEPLGELEAFHTAGGLSTMAFRYEGKIRTMEYKTLRYPGHAMIMQAIRDLGLLDVDEIAVNGARVAPRDVALAVLRERLTDPEGKDVVALRVVVSGTKDGRAARREYELVDRYDERHGISAMMRTTGYSLAITGLMQVRGEVRGHGVLTPDEAIVAEQYIAELNKRGVSVKVSSALAS